MKTQTDHPAGARCSHCSGPLYPTLLPGRRRCASRHDRGLRRAPFPLDPNAPRPAA